MSETQYFSIAAARLALAVILLISLTGCDEQSDTGEPESDLIVLSVIGTNDVHGELLTPPIEGSNLQGITRASVIQLAQDLDIPLRQTVMPRELLYAADELFFSGTASEITPIRSVDKIEVGEGRMGPVTRRLQERFLAIVRGEHKNNHGWLTPVN